MVKVEDYKTENSAKTRLKPQKCNKFCPKPKTEIKAFNNKALSYIYIRQKLTGNRIQ